jgi:hypothetical protein
MCRPTPSLTVPCCHMGPARQPSPSPIHRALLCAPPEIPANPTPTVPDALTSWPPPLSPCPCALWRQAANCALVLPAAAATAPPGWTPPPASHAHRSNSSKRMKAARPTRLVRPPPCSPTRSPDQPAAPRTRRLATAAVSTPNRATRALAVPTGLTPSRPHHLLKVLPSVHCAPLLAGFFLDDGKPPRAPIFPKLARRQPPCLFPDQAQEEPLGEVQPTGLPAPHPGHWSAVAPCRSITDLLPSVSHPAGTSPSFFLCGGASLRLPATCRTSIEIFLDLLFGRHHCVAAATVSSGPLRRPSSSPRCSRRRVARRVRPSSGNLSVKTAHGLGHRRAGDDCFKPRAARAPPPSYVLWSCSRAPAWRRLWAGQHRYGPSEPT